MVQKYSSKSDNKFEGRMLWVMLLIFSGLIKLFMFVSVRQTLLLIDHYCGIFTIPLLHIFIWKGERTCHFSRIFGCELELYMAQEQEMFCPGMS